MSKSTSDISDHTGSINNTDSTNHTEINLINTKYTNICFEGGGILGTAYAGCLERLDANGILDSIKNFAGSSAGCLPAAALACGADITYIKTVMKDFNPGSLADDDFGIFGDFYRLWNEYGWHKGDALIEWCSAIIEKLTGNPKITFKDVYRTYGHSLIITGTNLDKMTTEYFSHETTGDMPIVLAMRISCSFPWYFTAPRYNGSLYVDGGLGNNFPMNIFYIDDKPNPATLGVKLLSSDEINNVHKPVTSLKTHAMNILDMLYSQAQRVHVHSDDWENVIKINIGTMTSMNLNISSDEKNYLIDQGKSAADEFINKLL